MEYAILYNDISATYAEVAKALVQLGFHDVSTSENFHFVNEKENSEIKLPARPLETPFYKANLIGYSYILYMQGIIKHRDDFAKRIEKNRLAKKSKKNEQLGSN